MPLFFNRFLKTVFLDYYGEFLLFVCDNIVVYKNFPYFCFLHLKNPFRVQYQIIGYAMHDNVNSKKE